MPIGGGQASTCLWRRYIQQPHDDRGFYLPIGCGQPRRGLFIGQTGDLPHNARRPLAHGVDLWPEALMVARTPGRWRGPRVAFLEFVADDDPDQLAEDAECLRRWLGLSP